MPKTKISEFDVDPANNTDINSINIAEGCAPSGINNAIRQLMSDLKEFQTGAGGDPFNGAVNGTVGATTPASGAFTSLSASGAFAANGGATLGDASGDALTINSSAVSIPNGLNFDSNTLVIDATNNRVGVGTASPSVALDISSGNGRTTAAWQVSNNGIITSYTANTTGSLISNDSVAPIIFSPNNTERMRIDSSGNVGIGTSSPAQKLTLGANNVFRLQTGSVTLDCTPTPGGIDGFVWNQSVSTGYYDWATAGNVRMRIDSSGNLLVGTTSVIALGKQSILYSGALNRALSIQTSTGDGNAVAFVNSSGTVVGQIYQNASSTAYNTSSDYRLKENIAPMTGALAAVQALKPVTYKWKADGSNGQGFIAHELQAVVPDCVSGEKDAVNEDGSIKPQGIDTSFLVATLTAALQEAHGLIKDLQARVEALESK